MRSKELNVEVETMSIAPQQIERGRVKIIILDGVQGRAKVTEAVEHGSTIIETAKGKTTKIKFEEGELF
ncbi:XtrA/YqaO family protein [Sediminibacillus terrae]|uniref:XtrA/YqaO family protein n=1 Tax=Sediminibacillus terrae TaxID=1562106 RepID=UPI00235157CB|nr:XtrA/YqaO family protein [Sediminibacillus terrae]